MTSLEEFAGYAIKEEVMNNKVYMVLEDSSSASSDNRVVSMFVSGFVHCAKNFLIDIIKYKNFVLV